MMLRSSSTPVLGSLLQSISDSPNNNQSELHKHIPNSVHAKFSNGGGGRKSLFHPSPSLSEISGGGGGGFRRAQSDGNLEGLVGDGDEFNIPKRSARRNSLEAIPSFTPHNLWTSFEDDDDDYEGIEEEEESGDGFKLENSYNYNQMRMENMSFEKVARNANIGDGNLGKMYLASGIGVSGVDFAGRGGGGGGGGNYNRPVDFSKDGGDGGGGVGMEEHYKRMLEENPGNPLYLRNYAEFLYKIKGDYGGAEEYYARAILADQEDGESLSQYGKIIWELHHDKERAANYFERAIVASSNSSHTHAAYANFLWEAEDEGEDEDEDEDEENAAAGRGSQRFLHQGLLASATA